MKPKMKQPQTEATEAEAHEAARRWSRENRRSTTAWRITGRAAVGRSGYRHGRRKSMAEAGAGRLGRWRQPQPREEGRDWVAWRSRRQACSRDVARHDIEIETRGGAMAAEQGVGSPGRGGGRGGDRASGRPSVTAGLGLTGSGGCGRHGWRWEPGGLEQLQAAADVGDGRSRGR